MEELLHYALIEENFREHQVQQHQVMYGGIVGKLNDNGTVRYCYNVETVTNNKGYAGGIAGEIDGDNNSYLIEYCYNIGNITGRYAGGIAGHVSETIVNKCYNLADINATYAAGGIIGYASASGFAYYSVNGGNLYGTEYAGGINGTGYNPGDATSTYYYNGARNCISYAQIISSTRRGGIAGFVNRKLCF